MNVKIFDLILSFTVLAQAVEVTDKDADSPLVSYLQCTC